MSPLHIYTFHLEALHSRLSPKCKVPNSILVKFSNGYMFLSIGAKGLESENITFWKASSEIFCCVQI